MAGKNRAFPTEIDRNIIWLGQILISLQLKVYKRFSPNWTRNPSKTFSESS